MRKLQLLTVVSFYCISKWLLQNNCPLSPYLTELRHCAINLRRKNAKTCEFSLIFATTLTDFYAALLPRRGRILRRTLSVRLSVRPLSLPSVTSFRQPLASRMYFSARTEGRISYGHLGRTDSCFSFRCIFFAYLLT